MRSTISVLIVEDHQVTLDGLRLGLSREEDINVIGSATNSDEGLEIEQTLRSDIILLDLHLPGSSGPKSMVKAFCSLPSSRVIVNHIFDLLQLYSFHFNHTMGLSEFRVTCTKPAYVTEIIRYNKLRYPVETLVTFRCRLATRFWSLVIRGKQRSIDFILLPVDKILGFTRAEDGYLPSCQIVATSRQGMITWTVGEKELPSEQFQLICMDLFTELIEQTREEWRFDS